MHPVNFQNETGRRAAGERINQWASDATAARIPDLVDPRLFTELTRLVLTNAITFDWLWRNPFDDTNNANFALLDGTTVTVSLMRRRAIAPYAAGEDWQAAELAYEGECVHMLILLPAAGQFEEFGAECIIFGGQISRSYELFVGPIRSALKDIESLRAILPAMDIECSALKGAAKFVFDSIAGSVAQ
jgi:serine protease inhibitor